MRIATPKKEAPYCICKVVASLLSLNDSMLRNFYSERKQRLLFGGRYAQATTLIIT